MYMLGEVVKFIMSILAMIQWFFKVREWRQKNITETPLSAERPYSPAEQRHWRGYVVGNFVPLRHPTDRKRNCFIGKNPAYKSSNGF